MWRHVSDVAQAESRRGPGTRVEVTEETAASDARTSQADEQESAESDGTGGTAPAEFVDEMLQGLASLLLRDRRAVPLHQLLGEGGDLPGLSRTHLEELGRELRTQGYLRRSLDVARLLERQRPDLRASRRVQLIAGELAALEGDSHKSTSGIPAEGWRGAREGSVLLVMGRSMPDVETPYTRHVHALARALTAAGLKVSIATELGFRATGDGYSTEDVDGVTYHRLPGPARGDVPLDAWLRGSSHKLASVVRKVRPGALIAHSDFLNAAPAIECGRAYALPVVYEVNGDWDSSWYRRQQAVLGWPDPDSLALSHQGLPERYVLRRERERAAWADASAVLVTDSRTGLAQEVASVRATSALPVATADDDGIGAHLLLLEALGAVPCGSSAIAGVAVDREARGRLAARAETQRRPLERHITLDLPGSVETTMTTGWSWNGLEPVSLALPIDWEGLCAGNRSQDFRLHAWTFMAAVLLEFERGGSPELLDWCHDRAVSWCSAVVDEERATAMSWYDMGLALRAPVLAYLFELAVPDSRRTEAEIDVLHRGVVAHQRELMAPAAFNVATNHGFYLALGQIAFARRLAELPAMSVVLDQGRERLRQVAAGQFASDGGHREHSSDYHRMLVDSFVDAIDDDLIDDPETLALIDRAAHVTSWFIRPDGEIEQIGDSPARHVWRGTRSRRDPITYFVASGGERGTPPSAETLLLPEAGYAMVRAPAPTTGQELRESAYLTLMGAFHSRTHKHADDLSITWSDRGSELLIDSGRFGYLDLLPEGHPDRALGFFYSRPERQYVEGTPAHNTVTADGLDHDRRTREPYGSAVRDARRDGDYYLVEGEVDHGWWKHRRTAVVQPGVGLRVRDEMEALDGEEHTFTTWWNLPSELELSEQGANGLLLTRGGQGLRIAGQDTGSAWVVVKGQTEPLRGWRSRSDFELTPCWNVSRSVSAVNHVFETVFAFESDRETS